MIKLELEEHVVEHIISVLRDGSSELDLTVAEQVEKQLPLPVPANIGAIVESVFGVLYVRTDTDAEATYPWHQLVDVRITASSRDLPRIGKIHFAGIDD